TSFDSDDFPKGPVEDGGGEADTEQHCEACGRALENPLREEGMRARAERMGRTYLDLSGSGADDLRAMLDALERAGEVLPMTDEGNAVVDAMLDAVKADLQKIEYRGLQTVIHLFGAPAQDRGGAAVAYQVERRTAMPKTSGTLSDLKRRIVVGAKLICVENSRRPELNGRRRTVVKVQTNGFYFTEDG